MNRLNQYTSGFASARRGSTRRPMVLPIRIERPTSPLTTRVPVTRARSLGVYRSPEYGMAAQHSVSLIKAIDGQKDDPGLRFGGAAPRVISMADYYPLIAQAVESLDESTAMTRRAIYDLARSAMLAKLRSLTPELSASDIDREQVALDAA